MELFFFRGDGGEWVWVGIGGGVGGGWVVWGVTSMLDFLRDFQ